MAIIVGPLLRRRALRGAALALGLILGGCATEGASVEKKEDLLAASGFVARPANTAARQKMLATLPPHQFIRRAKGDQFIYLYSDPVVCYCLYIGNEKAYGAYQEARYDRQVFRDNAVDTHSLQEQELRQQQLQTQLAEDQNWDWGPWGPGWWY